MRVLGRGLVILIVNVLCMEVWVSATENQTACHELGGMSACALRDDCYFESITEGCKVDTWNCTCPGVIYTRSGWHCSCRVKEAYDKALVATRVDSCEPLLIAGGSNFAICPDDGNIHCRDQGDSFAGNWMVQTRAMRGNWVTGDWWSLPFNMGTYESHLTAAQPLEYVKVCVFDRLYTLGSDVLDLLRYRNSHTHAQPMEYPVMFTQARTGIAPSTRAYEYRIFIPAEDRRRKLLSHELGDEAITEVYEATNTPGKVDTSTPEALLNELKPMKDRVTDGLEVCGVHQSEAACLAETQFACHWNWREGHSYSCWVDTMNCICPDQLLTYTGALVRMYSCSCASKADDDAWGFLFRDAKQP
uniref:EGF-like domain-containing protein n=1 Tax=Pyramimonas obovata TaxID=1411642 RepID=A0A7S0MS18_9CHLO|mmetsp:Transcript_11237/g.23457  ORF Transcript_11237/g.23457 Transcript_11237/m.23457 type:complete len:360 (+) Transcript_11237:196-1275(+)